jgi:predicted porin
MNKKLIALAVAGAAVAPAAMAQTANPVTLYGRVHLTFEHVEVKGSAPAGSDWSKRTRIQDQASLLGVRGTEDLGGGTKVFFQLETAFAPDQTGGAFANRNSGVGFQGAWGSVLMGRWDTPFKVATGAIDPFGDVTIAGITMANNDQGNFDRRGNNVVQYWSPNWGGFAFRVQYQAEDGKTATATPQDWSASATFSRGPFYAYVAWEKHEDQVGTTATANKEEEGFSVGGTWAIGPVKIGGNWQKYEKTDRTDKESWLANIVWTLGNNQLIYQFQKSEDGQARGAGAPDCDVNSIAWQYNFSRRTFTQLIYSKIDNNQFANCGSPGSGWGGFGTITNGDPQGISFGVRHVF